MDRIHVIYLWIIVMFLSAVWTLILMAPIYTTEDPLVSKQQTNSSTVYLAWPKGEYIFS